VIAGLNSVLSGKLQGQFVTAAYLYLDLDAGSARYSAAGHPPLLHYRSGEQRVDEVVENGLILGVMPFADYDSKDLTVNAGDRFLLYTDGVLEADQKGEEFGEARLRQVMLERISAEKLCQLLSSQLSAWSQGVAGDDVTIIALEIA